jgi:enoyl-CoA hydratase/carnithine racemase
MIDKAASMSLDVALDYEVYMQEAAGRSEDYTNAVAAFREKKKAEFKGK